MPNRFELKQLREEAEKYQYHNAGNHGVWPRLVWEPRSKSPAERTRRRGELEEEGRQRAMTRYGSQAPPSPQQLVKETIITKEVVLIQCKHCGARYPQGTVKCLTCGANL